MKLIIQIPCFNEEKSLPKTFEDLPRHIFGIDEIEVLVIDDGSTDRTIDVAKELGVNHIVKLTNNKGLAEAFMAGLDASTKLGADIIVNTDGDNQYCGESIKNLTKPIIDGEADMVIGDRQVDTIDHFSYTKKKLQKIGSWVVRRFSNTTIPDVTSGFRAYSRDAALRLNVISRFSYTLETIIQAGRKNIATSSVSVKTNGKLRESRLFKSIPSYIKRSVGTMLRIYTMYEPLRVFTFAGMLLFSVGFFISVRFLYYYFFVDGGSGHIQSLILSAVLMLLGFQFGVVGIVADLISGHRQLTEDTLYRVKKLELGIMKLEKNSYSKNQPIIKPAKSFTDHARDLNSHS
ncbi:glycosyltransferase [candidate division KSB1 bacterium]|nr:glycosyltransferase [candidate division KSB1 bacterium]